MQYKFVCPVCGGVIAEEVVQCDGIRSEITHIGDGGLEYAPGDGIGDIIETTYGCANCNYIIPNVHDQDEFIEWCKENCDHDMEYDEVEIQEQEFEPVDPDDL